MTRVVGSAVFKPSPMVSGDGWLTTSKCSHLLMMRARGLATPHPAGRRPTSPAGGEVNRNPPPAGRRPTSPAGGEVNRNSPPGRTAADLPGGRGGEAEGY